MHADASGLFSQQDQKPYLNQAECKRARVGGSRGKGQHGESEGATTSSQKEAIGRAPPFIDTKLNLISIVSFLHDAAVLVSPGVGGQMAVALRASLPVVWLCA